MAALLATPEDEEFACTVDDVVAAAEDDAVEATELSRFCSLLIFCFLRGLGGLLKCGSM